MPARQRRAVLQDGDITFEALSAELDDAVRERERVGAALHEARAQAAPRLAQAVLERLAELAMADARFEVALRDRDGGYGSRGRDAVEFLIAPNPGLPFGPLREVASGGEMSRVMLALLSAAHGAAVPGAARCWSSTRSTPGIGGHTARAVGFASARAGAGTPDPLHHALRRSRPTADRHFTIAKDSSRTPAVTTVTPLDGDAVVDEIVRHAGRREHDEAARGHARELLKAA